MTAFGVHEGTTPEQALSLLRLTEAVQRRSRFRRRLWVGPALLGLALMVGAPVYAVAADVSTVSGGCVSGARPAPGGTCASPAPATGAGMHRSTAQAPTATPEGFVANGRVAPLSAVGSSRWFLPLSLFAVAQLLCFMGLVSRTRRRTQRVVATLVASLSLSAGTWAILTFSQRTSMLAGVVSFAVFAFAWAMIDADKRLAVSTTLYVSLLVALDFGASGAGVRAGGVFLPAVAVAQIGAGLILLLGALVSRSTRPWASGAVRPLDAVRTAMAALESR